MKSAPPAQNNGHPTGPPVAQQGPVRGRGAFPAGPGAYKPSKMREVHNASPQTPPAQTHRVKEEARSAMAQKQAEEAARAFAEDEMNREIQAKGVSTHREGSTTDH